MNTGRSICQDGCRIEGPGRLLALLLAFVLIAFGSRAVDVTTGFDAANKLYEQGKFAEALAGYDTLLAQGGVSAAVWFNRGNALVKLGRLGQAVASYREAQWLAPRDRDVRANLQLARTRARGGTPYPVERWRDWLGSLSLDAWCLLAAGALWVMFLLLAAVQWRRELAPKLRQYIYGAAAAVAVLGLCLAVELNVNYFARSAIIAVGEAEVRNGPLDESPSLYKVRDGVELNVIGQKDNWLQVIDAAQRVGWVRRDQVLIFDPAEISGSRPQAG